MTTQEIKDLFWQVATVFGGISVVVVGITVFVFSIIQSRMLDKWKAADNTALETLKSTLSDNGTILASALTRSLPDAVVSQRLKALERVWDFAMKTKKKFPTLYYYPFQILTDKELTDVATIQELTHGTIASRAETEKLLISNPIVDLEGIRWIISIKLWNILFVYQGVHNRMFYLFTRGFTNA
jgi:hypothetical protein